jgi:hypothetical protein
MLEENEKDGAGRHALNILRMRGLARRPSFVDQLTTKVAITFYEAATIPASDTCRLA